MKNPLNSQATGKATGTAKSSKKTLIIGFLALTLSLFITFGLSASQAQAQYATNPSGLTASQIYALIQNYQSQISLLQQLLAQQQPTQPPSTGYCIRFNTDLTVGSTSQDVAALHSILEREGITIGGTIPGNTYSAFTSSAVRQLQGKYGIRQTGYFGPITRAKMNSLYTCIIVPTTPTPTYPTYPPYPQYPTNPPVPSNPNIQLRTSVQLVPDSQNKSFLSAWIVGNQQNQNVALWKLKIECSSNMWIQHTYGQNMCGQELSVNGANIGDPTRDYLFLSTQFTYPGTIYGGTSNTITLTLTAYNAAGYYLGEDKEVLTIASSGQNPNNVQLSVLTPTSGSVWTTGNAYTIRWSATNNEAYDSYQLIIGNTLTNTTRVLYDHNSVVSNIARGQTSYTWNIPTWLISDFTQGTAYTQNDIRNSFYIRVNAIRNDASGATVVAWARSDSFTILGSTNTTLPTITSISPNYGPENTVVTIYGSGLQSNARVLFAGSIITPLYVSPDGAWLQFRIPQGSLVSGSKQIQVANQGGQYSTALSFNLIQ